MKPSLTIPVTLSTVALAGVLLVHAAAGTGTYTTAFTRTENPLSESGQWAGGRSTGANLWGDVRTTPGFAFGVDEPTQFGDPTAILTGSWGPNQTVEGTVKIRTTPTRTCCHEIELRLRATISPNSITGYEAYCSTMPDYPYCHIARWNGPNGSYCNLDPTPPALYVVNGDVLKATATGTNPVVVTLYRNGAQILQISDTGANCSPGGPAGPFRTGNPGIGFYDDHDSKWADFGLSTFTATAR